MKIRKLIALLLTLAVVLACAPCSFAAKKPADRLDQIKEKGVLEVATEPYFAPGEFIDSRLSGDEQYVGMDIEIAKVIADRIGVELKIVPLEFSAVLVGTVEGKYDLAISSLGYSEERAQAMRLSVGYWFSGEEGGYGFVCREEDAGKYETIEDVQKAVVVTQSASVQEGLYNKYIGTCKQFKLLSAMTDAFLAVQEGKADVCICDTTNAQLYADANGGLYVPAFRFPTDPETDGTRIGAPLEGTESLMELVNEVVTELLESGQTNEWHDFYAEYAKSLGLDVN